MHGSVLEWIQLIVGSTGTFFNLWVLRQSYLDHKWVEEYRPFSAIALLVSEGNLRGEMLNSIMALLTLLAGITAVSVPPPPGIFTVTAIWKLYVLIAISIMLCLQGWRGRNYRRRILGINPSDKAEKNRSVGKYE